jgi:butyrate kinase
MQTYRVDTKVVGRSDRGVEVLEHELVVSRCGGCAGVVGGVVVVDERLPAVLVGERSSTVGEPVAVTAARAAGVALSEALELLVWIGDGVDIAHLSWSRTYEGFRALADAARRAVALAYIMSSKRH